MITSKVIELEKQKFEIRKMDAVSGERWFLKALSLIGHGLNLDVAQLSETGLNINDLVKALCNVPFDESYELLNELFTCVYRKIDGKVTEQLDINTVSGYITNPITLMNKRVHYKSYHTDEA